MAVFKVMSPLSSFNPLGGFIYVNYIIHGPWHK